MGACQNIGRVFYLRGGFNTPTHCVEVADCIFFNLKIRNITKNKRKYYFIYSSTWMHEFLFGCNGFLVADLVNQFGEENAEGNENVRQFLDVFNFATLPFFSYSGRRMHPNPKAEFFPRFFQSPCRSWCLLFEFN